MKKQGALSKIREGEIDNQWFREPKMTIVPRPSQESRKRDALKEQRLHTPPPQALHLLADALFGEVVLYAAGYLDQHGSGYDDSQTALGA